MAEIKLTMCKGKTEKVIATKTYDISQHCKKPEAEITTNLAKGIGIRFKIYVGYMAPGGVEVPDVGSAPEFTAQRKVSTSMRSGAPAVSAISGYGTSMKSMGSSGKDKVED